MTLLIRLRIRAARRGIWTNGKLAESPAEYKRRIREAKDAKTKEDDEDDAESPAQGEPSSHGLVRRFLGW